MLLLSIFSNNFCLCKDHIIRIIEVKWAWIWPICLSIDEEFLCSICHDVLKEPMQITKCQHTFCKLCINEWLNDNQTVLYVKEKMLAWMTSFLCLRYRQFNQQVHHQMWLRFFWMWFVSEIGRVDITCGEMSIQPRKQEIACKMVVRKWWWSEN